MLEILISSTVLILALTALRFFLRGKLNPRLQYTLWLLAALRLLLPVSLVRSPVSVMNAVPDVPAAVQRLTAPENRRAPQTDNTQSPVQTASETETAPTEAQTQLTGSTILKLVWLTGAAAMALVVLAQNLRFLRRLKRIRQPFACPKSPVPVWVASGLPSPCLAGLFRPEFISRPKRRRTRRHANSSFVTSWRIITRGISSGASCASSASVCTGSTPSCGLPRRFPGATASWPATSGC